MPQSPHDALFRYTFGQPEHAASLLRDVLPKAISTVIDWSTLALQRGSFVDETLAWRHTDLLFRAQMGDSEALIYLLVEHQSVVDPRMVLRMLRYVLRIWDSVAAEHALLPLVIPLVVFHGRQPWSAPSNVRDLVALQTSFAQSAAPHVPSMEILVVDLTRTSDRELRDRAMTHLATLTLLSLTTLPRASDPIEALRQLLDLAVLVTDAPRGLDALTAVLRYLATVTGTPPQAVREVLEEALGSTTTEAVMITMAERWIEEGQHKGKAALVLKLLALKFGEISSAIEDRVRSASADNLDLFAERILTATTVEEVIGRE